MARLNKLIEVLAEGKTAFGSGTIPNGNYRDAMNVVETSYDFVIIDMEHENFDIPGLRTTLQYMLSRKAIAESGSLQQNVTPIVRIPPNAKEKDQWVMKQILDAGVYGIVQPHVGNVEEARHVVAAIRYPRPTEEPNADNPPGERGWYPGGPARYWGLSVNEYYKVADLWPLNPDGEIFLMPICESVEGVKNLSKILKEVKGISAIWAGAGDLSTDMGLAGQPNHPRVEEGVQAILKACKDNDVPCCIGVNEQNIEQRMEQGFRIILAGPSRSYAALETGKKLAGR